MRRRGLIVPLSLSFLMVGIATAATSQKPRPNQHKASTTEQNQRAQNQEPQVPVSTLQSSEAALREALSTIKKEAEATKEQADAEHEHWYSPSVLVQWFLVAVGVAYSVFAALQWSAIREQSEIARDVAEAAKSERPYLFVERPRMVKTYNAYSDAARIFSVYGLRCVGPKEFQSEKYWWPRLDCVILARGLPSSVVSR
jgi:hypothetical protein